MPKPFPVCSSCGKSTRSHRRLARCLSCAQALADFVGKFGDSPKTYNVWTDDVSLDRWTDSPVAATRLGKLAARWLDAPVHVTEYTLRATPDGYQVDGHSDTRLATYTPPQRTAANA